MPSSRWDAVIFDYGRVLSLTPSDAEMQRFAALVGVSEPPFFEIYSATRHDYDRGLTDFRQHWQAFCDAAGVKLGPAQVERIAEMETLMWLRVNQEAVALARVTALEALSFGSTLINDTYIHAHATLPAIAEQFGYESTSVDSVLAQ